MGISPLVSLRPQFLFQDFKYFVFFFIILILFLTEFNFKIALYCVGIRGGAVHFPLAMELKEFSIFLQLFRDLSQKNNYRKFFGF